MNDTSKWLAIWFLWSTCLWNCDEIRGLKSANEQLQRDVHTLQYKQRR